MKKANTSTRIVQSVDRALEIIDCFNEYETELSLGTICEKLSLNKSTAMGLINTMIGRGYLDKNIKNGKYRLGKVLLSKHSIADSAYNKKLREMAEIYLKRLYNKYHVHLCFYKYADNNLSVVYNINPPMSGGYYLLSTNKEAYSASASGKVVLAHYNELQLKRFFETVELAQLTEFTKVDPEEIRKEIEMTRERGYGKDENEAGYDILALAVPIYDSLGNLCGTIGAGEAPDIMRGIKDELIADLKNYSAEITRKMFI